MKTEIVPVVEKTSTSETLPSDPDPLKIGQWYWVQDEDEDEPWFGCITHVGSNYVEMTSTHEDEQRIHFNEFDSRCKLEADPERVISGQILRYQTKVQQLMGRIAEVTSRLGVADSPKLQSGSETAALATVDSSGQNFNTYKTDLVTAKKETLPKLFDEIEETNLELVRWMKAQTVPFQAKVEQMKGVIGRIDDRIFNVDLYAGLSEQVEQITDGEPAPFGEKIRLLQRRLYMDEECLARYQTGGMEFKNIQEFDAWLARPDNLERLMPFPRCIVSFRVRRNMKTRPSFGSFIDFFRIIDEIKADTYTFLYIRNGEKLYRMGSELDFGEKLFPDMDRQKLTGKLWAKGAPRISEIISDDAYQGLLEDHAREVAQAEADEAAHKIKLAAWEAAHAKAEAEGQEFKESRPWYNGPWLRDPREDYQEFEPSNIYYDDILNKVEKDIQHHNRIGLILQGLLDRSLVLHPHPPWKIWTTDGFREALELVYDDSRALVAGEKPDFEAYRQKANESLRAGSVTVGQEVLWEIAEAEKYNEKEGRQGRNGYEPERYRPYGNPGPGTLARVAEYEPRNKRCTYAWMREGQSSATYGQEIRAKFTCTTEALFNADAYKPGDFHRFFDDPRTRADYLKWAPVLLEAEEYHAGNRDIGTPPAPKKKKESSYSGQRAYQRRLARKSLLGKAVRNRTEIHTKGGKVYKKNSLWHAARTEGGLFTIYGLLQDGSADSDRMVRRVSPDDLVLEPDVIPKD